MIQELLEPQSLARPTLCGHMDLSYRTGWNILTLSKQSLPFSISGSDCFAGINLASSEYFFCITRMTFSWKWQGLISARLWPR